MKTLIAPLLALLLASSAAAQVPLRAESFAHRSAIALGGSGPFHQLTLPLAVYQGAMTADLADLRVFNGQGEVLPYALLRSESSAELQQAETAAPFFPLPVPGKAGPADLSVSVRQVADGTLIAVRQTPAGPRSDDLVQGVVVDASRLQGSIRSLRLLTAASKLPFHRYAIETSPDLQGWRVLKRDAQVVHLEHDGHRIDRDAVEWEGTADRYLRLIWSDPQRAPEIRSVLLGTVETSVRPAPRIWSAELAPSAVQAGVYDYTWPVQMPLEKLRVNLPQLNMLAPLAIQQRTVRSGRHHLRHRDEVRWATLARTVAYRLESPEGEIRSPDIALPGGVTNHLRLAVDARGAAMGSTPPTVQVGFVPHALIFLARGEGPFVLAWGASGLARADLPVSTLMPGHDGKGSPAAAPASLVQADGGEMPPAVPSSAVPESPSGQAKWMLWAVLLGGVLVLGGMARTLLGHLRRDPDTKP